MSSTALFIIDIQKYLVLDSYPSETPIPNSPAFLSRIETLLSRVRAVPLDGRPLIVVVVHDGDKGDIDEPQSSPWESYFPALTPSGSAIPQTETQKDGDAPEWFVRKQYHSVFESNPDLADALRDRSIKDVVVAGLQSEYCVRAGTLGARDEGFNATLLQGAHSTKDNDKESAVGISARIEGEVTGKGARLVDWEDWLREMGW